ncbi:YjcZ family sporulation protein [Neobacillus niacini]|uniref:YjcZ family sporulation protein n=1 Tax=Neobacillus niacini TaxID=86668 RepID=UPI003B5876F2
MHYGYGQDCCGFGYPGVGGIGYGCNPGVGGIGYGCGTFVLIVVLFILLIIIGASWC